MHVSITESALTEAILSWYCIYGDVLGESIEPAITAKGQAAIPKVICENRSAVTVAGLCPGVADDGRRNLTSMEEERKGA